MEDKDETFASTPSLTALRLLTLAVAKGWHIAIGDISAAFLHALVSEDFYVIKASGVLPRRTHFVEASESPLRFETQPQTLAAALCFCHGEEQL